ncbi:MAG TPA: potassium transporter TrkG [Kineosporiaceae bacterium]|nr:potassium transporter TrkG [Kineosporiaceae bacterium]
MKLRHPHRGPWRHPVRWAVLGLLGLTAVGTLLLLLPVATAGKGTAGLSRALFTAVSASCGTGLSVVDTGTFWSPFGQVVILCLVQVGGLGLMISATLLGLAAASRLGLRTRLLAESATGTVDLGTVRRVVVGSAAIAGSVEALATAALTLRLWLGHGYGFGRALWYGLFHGVGAFNNSAFTLWPDSLTRFAGDGPVLATVGLAVVIGGLGYPVLLEVLRVRPRQRWSVHTRITLVATAVLLVLGPLAVAVSEWTNPATLGHLDTGGKLLSGVFAGITPRTSGLATFDYAHADASTLLVTDVLMLIGAGSGGTGGGIKVTTLALLVMAVLAEVRGHADVPAFGRRIAPATVRQALAVWGLAAGLLLAASITLLELTGADLDRVAFEVTSAFGNVGLSTGLTRQQPGTGQATLALLMLIGRAGPIAVATALALRPNRQPFRQPEARPILG